MFRKNLQTRVAKLQKKSHFSVPNFTYLTLLQTSESENYRRFVKIEKKY